MEGMNVCIIELPHEMIPHVVVQFVFNNVCGQRSTEIGIFLVMSSRDVVSYKSKSSEQCYLKLLCGENMHSNG